MLSCRMGGDPFAVLKHTNGCAGGGNAASRMGGDPFAVLKLLVPAQEVAQLAAAWGETLLRY